MRIRDLLENDLTDTDDFDDMDLSDALFMLAEMVDDDKLSEKEVEVIEEMFEKLFALESLDDMSEAIISDHGATEEERKASFQKTSLSDRLKNRIYQRRYRRSAEVKARERKKALIAKRCKGKDRSVQLSAPNSSSYVCKLKNKFRSKLMRMVAKRYN